MGRQMIYRDTRMVGANISARLFHRAVEVQARQGFRTFTEVLERALQMYTDSILGPNYVSTVGIEAPGPRPEPHPKINLAIGDPPVEDIPVITTRVPKEEAIAAVDQSPRPYDPAKDDVMDYIRGKRS